MPFRKWTVEPTFLCRNVSEDEDHKIRKFPGYELETVVNLSLVKCLYQLASVVKVADRIFEDVGSECRIVYERIERLRIKIGSCNDSVSKLNARAVHVPISDLCSVSKLLRQKKPYKTVYTQRTQLFLPSNRPPCIDYLYSDASASPVSVICTVDKYRTDGCTSSELFMVTPVLGGEDTRRKRRRKMLDIETRKPANFSLARIEQDESKTGGETSGDKDDGIRPSTSLDEVQRGKEMTLSRLPSPEEQTMAMSMEYPSTVVPVDISGSSFFRMSTCRRSLIHADFVIKRRKNKGKQKRRHTVCEGSNNRDLEKALENITMVNSSCQTDDLTSEAPQTFFRRSFYRRRAKSMEGVRRETVALESLNLDLCSKRSESSNQSSQADGLNGTLKKNSSQSTSSSKKQGKLSLMTRANPILNSLSTALSNAAVRFRHPTKSKQDVDGRSSSGNWSASSSTRASVDSDQHHAVIIAAVDRSSNLSRSSAGKDSLLSEATQHEPARTRENPVGSGQVPTLESLSDKARALRNGQPWEYDRDRGRESCTSTPERSSDCASTPLVISPYIGRRNRFNFYGASSSIDDGESSVYSVDTDGYYTSMHTDSGLWNGLGTPKGGEFRARHRRESQSSISTIGNVSVNSILSRTVTENSETGSFHTQKFAPDPPPRSNNSDQKTDATLKITRDHVEGNNSTAQGFVKENSPPRNGSASESDYETGDRIRCKTTINPSRYPSLCAVSPETSDDELAELREKSKSPAVSIVVAEVHRSDDSTVKAETDSSNKDVQTTASPSTCINMYGSNNSPSKSLFNSSLIRSGQMSTSTPKQKTSVTSFASENRCSPITKVAVTPTKQLEDLPYKSHISSRPFNSGVKFKEMTAVPIPSVPNLEIPDKSSVKPKPVPSSSKPEQSSHVSKTDVGKTVSAAAGKSKSFLKNPLSSLPFRQSESSVPKSTKSSPPSYISFQSPDSPVSSSTALSTDNISSASMTNQGSRMSYLSRSLDRSRTQMSDSSSRLSHAATLPRCQSSSVHESEAKTVTDDDSQSRKRYSVFRENVSSQSKGKPPVPISNNAPSDQSPRAQNVFFRPSRGGRFCRTYFPSHLISPREQSTTNESKNSTSSESHAPTNGGEAKESNQLGTLGNINDVGLPSSDPYPQPPRVTRTLFPSPSPVPRTVGINIRSSPVQFTSSPALPGKWSSSLSGSLSRGEPALRVPAATYKFHPLPKISSQSMDYPVATRQAVLSVSTPTTSRILDHVAKKAMHEQNSPIKYHCPREMNRLPFQTEFTPPNPPDLIPSSSTPPSTLDITSRICPKQSPRIETRQPVPTNTDRHQHKLKSLSSNELFAIIHDSKKKHNIKTESEKSLSPLSSRSSSPSVSSVSSPSKTQRVETGVLSRNCDSPSVSSLPGGLVSDRFGRPKPTSMHDFKMLLLQARAGNQDSNTRPSAAELLKVSPTRRSLALSPVTGSSKQTNPPTWAKGRLPPPQNNNPQSPVHVGGITVKRNMRNRSPYLTRYDSAYPPIWEDCSEETEDAADENQNTVVNTITLGPVEDVLGSSNKYRCTPVNRNILNNQSSGRTSTWV